LPVAQNRSIQFCSFLLTLAVSACGGTQPLQPATPGSDAVASGSLTSAAAATPSLLGSASSFAVLGGSAVTCTTSSVTGDVGVSPGTALTLTSCPIAGGTVHANDAAAVSARRDFDTAYAALALERCDRELTGSLAGQTLAPGVYCFTAASTSTGGVLTLDGPANGRWLFKVGTSGTGALTGTGFSVVMRGGGTSCNVFWRVAEAVTATDSNFQGTILAGAAITLTGGTLVGRALAQAAVTMTGTNVSVGNCVAAPRCDVKAKFEGTVDCAAPIATNSFVLTDGTMLLVDVETRIDGKSRHHDAKGYKHEDKIASLGDVKKACDRHDSVEVGGQGAACAHVCPRTIRVTSLHFDASDESHGDDEDGGHD
jgi:hypothetical protein